jgi:tyrosine-protein phosphatase SIW14
MFLRVLVGVIAIIFLSVTALAQEGERCSRKGRDSWAKPIYSKINGVLNVHRVSENIYRSGQPNQVGFRSLKEHFRIGTVISLRNFHSDRPLGRGLSLTLLRYPITPTGPETDRVIKALAAIRSSQSKSPAEIVLVHCLHGSDRTGLIIALYRILYENWCREEAIQEMQSEPFGFNANWTRIPSYIREIDIESMRRQIDSQLR